MPRFLTQTLDESFARKVRASFSPDLPSLIAVSGGRDSMALLHFLHSNGYHNLTAVHVNHGLRGKDADADECLVLDYAESIRCQCVIFRVDVGEFAKEQKLSIEEAARELRYTEIARAAEKLDLSRVFLAHHGDDQVETILFRLFRGSGSRGIAGMSPSSSREIDGISLKLLRPWLSISKSEVNRYLVEHEIPFREDLSNQDDFSIRNRIRNRLLPDLEEIFERDVRGSVLKVAELARRDENYFSTHIPPLLMPKDHELDVATLRRLEPAIRDRLLLQWLRDEGVPDCGYSEVEKVASVALSEDKPAKENLPAGIHVRRRQGILFLEFPQDIDKTLG